MMEKTTWRQKVLFMGLCCAYILLMSASVYVLSHRSGNENIVAANQSRNTTASINTPNPPILDNDTARSTLKFVPESLTDSPSPMIIEMQTKVFQPERLFSARGKAAEKLLHPVIAKAADQYDVDPALIKSIIWAESSFNPNAISPKGAMGLMQLMPQTAESLGVTDGFNPESNIFGGVRYFKQLMDRFKGDARLALAAYNAGSERVMEYKGVPPFEATQFYIDKVLQYYHAYKRFESGDVDQI